MNSSCIDKKIKASSNSKIVSDIKLTLEQSIEKTGYVLEHKVASFFEKAKWSVIHNRYCLFLKNVELNC
ncbi:MAG: hypothetical protein H7141_01275 [Burkholderiales bacterium]|nr:hypothetical protein [Bacteroidia bacterium]